MQQGSGGVVGHLVTAQPISSEKQGANAPPSQSVSASQSLCFPAARHDDKVGRCSFYTVYYKRPLGGSFPLGDCWRCERRLDGKSERRFRDQSKEWGAWLETWLYLLEHLVLRLGPDVQLKKTPQV